MAWNVATYDDLFRLAGERYAGGTGLDPASFAALLKAHASVESGFVPTAYRAESGGRASRGLMQMLDTTARSLGYAGPLGDDSTRTGGLYDPAVAIPLAAQLVRQNLLASENRVAVAIAAYNEGIGRAQQDADSGAPFRTADPRYVDKVQAAFTQFAGDFGPPPDAGPLVADTFGRVAPWWALVAIAGGIAAWLYFH